MWNRVRLRSYPLIQNYMDEKLTAQVQEYINADAAGRDVMAGAALLLRLNRNRILYQNVMRRPEKYADKVLYELKKYLQMRLDKKTTEDVVLMLGTVLPSVDRVIKEGDALSAALTQDDITDTEEDGEDLGNQDHTLRLGKREDHDLLPAEIQACWDNNVAIFKNIKHLYEQLKSMEDSLPCDRYEYLKQLSELDEKYRANFQKYDNFRLENGTGGTPDSEADIAKKVSAARKYISDNKKKLVDLKGTDEKKYAALLAKVQERYDFLIANNCGIDDTQKTELGELGVSIA